MALPPLSPPTRAHNHAAPSHSYSYSHSHTHSHSPTHPRRPHVRRSSASSTSSTGSIQNRCSFSNLDGSRSPRSFSFSRQGLSSPPIMVDRTPCPRDGDAFSYDPKHLSEWFIHDDLWCKLPEKLRTRLAAVQHAGAAVLTGFERLEEISGTMRKDGLEAAEIHTPRSIATDMDNDAVSGNKQTRPGRIDSFTGTDRPDGVAHSTLEVPPVGANRQINEVTSGTESRMSPLPSPVNSPPVNPLETAPMLLSSTFSDDGHSLSPGMSSPALSSSASNISSMMPYTEIPASRPSRREDTPSVRSRHPSTDGRHHFRTHSAYSHPPTPRDPQTSRYLSELSHLRCVSIVRLRHKARGVDNELGDLRRDALPEVPEFADEFESWWVHKREFAGRLDAEGAAIENRQMLLDQAQRGDDMLAHLHAALKQKVPEDEEVSPLASPELKQHEEA